jgi:hypothetical protein
MKLPISKPAIAQQKGRVTRTVPALMKTAICLILLMAGGVVLQGCASSKHQKASPSADDARAYFEVLRSDFNAEKVRTLNEVMKLTVAEADKFWPLYRSYEQELAPVSDRKLELIRKFLTLHKDGTLTDESSKQLAGQWLQNAQDRLDLWKVYSERISRVVSPMRGAQFLQVENQMALFVDISIASEMPLLGSKPEEKQ